MLHFSQLDNPYWEDAVKTACYVGSRIPHKRINNEIPFEILYKKKADLRNLRI